MKAGIQVLVSRDVVAGLQRARNRRHRTLCRLFHDSPEWKRDFRKLSVTPWLLTAEVEEALS